VYKKQSRTNGIKYGQGECRNTGNRYELPKYNSNLPFCGLLNDTLSIQTTQHKKSGEPVDMQEPK
jgi:hypothetical protein